MDIDGFQAILDDAADGVPAKLLERLNGGVVLLPEAKPHPADRGGGLYIMGEYIVRIPGLGRYIAIYYGSFERVFGRHTPNGSKRLRDEVKKTLAHELRHHIESLSGVRDLEDDDERRLEAYFLRAEQTEAEW